MLDLVDTCRSTGDVLYLQVTMTETSEFRTPTEMEYSMEYMDCDKRQSTTNRMMMHKRIRGNRYSEDMILN